MSPLSDRLWTSAVLFLLWGFVPTTVTAQAGTASQQLSLQPGWNAVFVEVQPDPARPEEVFQGLPVDVWSWLDVRSPVEFIQDPAEGLARRRGWHGYLSNPRDRFLTNLHAIHANRAYLIKLRGAAPVPATITGRPVLRPMRWVPDSFNLVGFHFEPGAEPTFGELLGPSAAHRGQAVYRLTPGGTWEFVAETARARSGEAYWIYTEGASQYQGLLAVDAEVGGSLDYGTVYDEQDLIITSWSPAAVTATLTSGFSNPELRVRGFDTDLKVITWTSLPHTETLAPAAADSLGQTVATAAKVALAVRGVSGLGEAVLEVRGAGMRYRVPVSARE